MKVIVFSTPDCANCKPLKASLAAAGVVFEEVNCHQPEAFALMREYGIRSVPTTAVVHYIEGLPTKVFKVAGNKPQEILELVK